MSDLFSRLNGGEILPVVIVTIVFASVAVVAIVALIAHYVTAFRRNESIVQLKREMLDRGMSADEIKTVLEAGQHHDG